MNERCGTCRRWRADEDHTTDTTAVRSGTCRASLPVHTVVKFPTTSGVKVAEKLSKGGLAIAEQVTIEMQVQAFWPPTASNAWCAQYKPALPWFVRLWRSVAR